MQRPLEPGGRRRGGTPFRPEITDLKTAITAVVTLLLDETATLSLEEVESVRADIDRFRAELWFWGKRHSAV